MKKRSLLFLALATLLASSCSSDLSNKESGDGASLKLTITGSSSVSRANGILPTQDEENTVSGVTVGLFDHSTGKTDVITEGTLSGGAITITNATAGSRDVIVVANAPTGTFAGALTIDDFRKRTLSLCQTKNNLPMSGESSSAVTLTGGKTVTAEVGISRMAARIQLTSLKTDFSTVGQYANATFTLDKVFLYNAMSTSPVGIVSPATQLSTSGLVHGWIGGGNTNEGSATTSTDLVDILATDQLLSSTAYTTPYYFYTFENYYSGGITDENKSTATKLVVSGWFTPDKSAPDTKYYVYYPAVINRSQTGTIINATDSKNKTVDVSNKGIERNNIYSIDATIRSIGVDSPDKFMEPAGLTLTVTVADWNLTVSQTVDF
jgi:hypothetical protein